MTLRFMVLLRGPVSLVAIENTLLLMPVWMMGLDLPILYWTQAPVNYTL